MPDRKLKRVIEPFSMDIDGVPTTFRRGDLVWSDNIGVQTAPGAFQDAEEGVARPDVEQATAAPGEKRGEKRG